MAKSNWIHLAAFSLILFSSSAYSSDVRINGFGSLVGTHADFDGFYDGWYDRGVDFEGASNVAVNLSKQISPKIELTTQFLALGRDSFEPTVRLAQINWRVKEEWIIRAGKIRFPFWLLSDVQEVGVLLPWSRPPAEVYFNPFSTLTGVSSLYTYALSDDWNFDFELYAGGGQQKFNTRIYRLDGQQSDVIGANINFRNADHRLRLGYAQGNFEGNTYVFFENQVSLPGNTINAELVNETNLPSTRYLAAGYKFDNSRFLVLSEFIQVNYDNAGERITFAESHYFTAGVYFSDFLLHATRSRLGVNNVDTRPGTPSSHSVGLNWFYSYDLVFKMDYTAANELASTTYNVPDRVVSIFDLSLSFAF